MNEDIDNDKDYQIMELKQRISYYEPYKQKYEDLKEDWKYIKSLLDKEFNERTRLMKENEQLEKGKMEALSLLGEEIDKNEQLRQVVEEYRKTNKHLSELCADASKNGYLPPLEDFYE